MAQKKRSPQIKKASVSTGISKKTSQQVIMMTLLQTIASRVEDVAMQVNAVTGRVDSYGTRLDNFGERFDHIMDRITSVENSMNLQFNNHLGDHHALAMEQEKKKHRREVFWATVSKYVITWGLKKIIPWVVGTLLAGTGIYEIVNKWF